MQETSVQSLCWEDPLENRKATHSSILAGEFQGLFSLWGHKESGTTEQLSLSLHFHYILTRITKSWKKDVADMACEKGRRNDWITVLLIYDVDVFFMIVNSIFWLVFIANYLFIECMSRWVLS